MPKTILQPEDLLSFFESPAFMVSDVKCNPKVVGFNPKLNEISNRLTSDSEAISLEDFLKNAFKFNDENLSLFSQEFYRFANLEKTKASQQIEFIFSSNRYHFNFEKLTFSESTSILVVLDLQPSSKENFKKDQNQLEIEAFQQIFESLPIGIAVSRISDSMTLYVNQKLTEIYGWGIEDLKDVNNFFLKVYPDEAYRKEVSEMILKDITSGNPEQMQWKNLKITTKSGDVKIVNAKNIPLYDQDLMISTVEDVSESYNIQDELNSAKNRFDLAAQATSDAVWEWDLSKDELYWGEGYERLFGYKFENNIVPKDFWKSKIHPNDAIPFFKSLKEAKKDKGLLKWTFDYRFLKKDGDYAHVRENIVIVRDDTGSPVRLVGALQDITKPMKREIHLHLLEKLIAGANDAIMVSRIDSNSFLDSEIIYANTSFQKLFECDTSTIIGKTPQTFYLTEKNKDDFLKLNEKLKDWDPVEIDLLSFTESNIEFWNRLSITPIMDDEGWFTHFMIINKNVNDLKTNQEKNELLAFTHQAFQGEKLIGNILCKISMKIGDLVRSSVCEIWMSNAYDDQLMKLVENREGEQVIIEEKTKTRTDHFTKQIFDSKKPLFQIHQKEAVSSLGKDIKLSYGFQIQSHGDPIGVVVLGFKNTYSREDTLHTIFNEFSIQLANEISRKRSENEMSDFFEYTPDFLCIAGKDGFLKRTNKRASEILGYSQDEFLNTPFLDFIVEEDHKETMNLLSKAWQDEGYHSKQIRIISKNAKILEVDWTIFSLETSEEVLCVGKDVTSYTANLKDLKTQIEKFEILSRTVKDAVWDFDLITKKMTWGLGLHKLFGYDPENFGEAEEVWLEKLHPKDRKRVKDSFYCSLTNTEENDWREEYKLKKSDGTYANVLDRGTIIRDEEGKPLRMVGSLQDITEYKEYQHKLEQLNHQLIKQTQSLTKSNKDLEEFAYIASHDLQEPLRMITGFLTRLEQKYAEELDDKAKEYIDFAVDGAIRMRQIINGLLNFSKVGRQDLLLSKVDVASVIEEVKLLLLSIIEENKAEIETNSLPVIYSVSVELKEVFLNLIENSIKYSKKDEIPIIKIEYKEESKDHLFSVTDNGIGISEEYFDKIFGIFQRLHGQSEYSGTGIGLAIVKKIISNLGGCIDLESELGKGTRFLIRLPKKSTKNTLTKNEKTSNS